MKKSVKGAQRSAACERIAVLFEEAAKRPEFAGRYMQLVDKLKRRYKVRLTPEQRRKVCKKCLAFLVPGRNCSVRTKNGHLVITCKGCGHLHRYPYVRERKRI